MIKLQTIEGRQGLCPPRGAASVAERLRSIADKDNLRRVIVSLCAQETPPGYPVIRGRAVGGTTLSTDHRAGDWFDTYWLGLELKSGDCRVFVRYTADTPESETRDLKADQLVHPDKLYWRKRQDGWDLIDLSATDGWDWELPIAKVEAAEPDRCLQHFTRMCLKAVGGSWD